MYGRRVVFVCNCERIVSFTACFLEYIYHQKPTFSETIPLRQTTYKQS